MKAALGALTGLFLAAAAPAQRGIAAFGWMSGSWETVGGGRWTEEYWSPPRGGVMLGFSRSGSGGAVREFEFIRLAPDDAGIVTYWASPSGRPAIGFRLVEAGDGKAVFENPAHDYPVRISYRREGATMTATTSGRNGANPQRWVYRRRPD